MDNIRLDIRAVRGQALTGNSMLLQTLDKGLIGGFECIGFFGLAYRHPRVIQHNGLNPLGTHDSPHTASSGMSRGPELGVSNCN